MSNLQKRKRTVVSYAQPDQLAELLGDDEDIATVPYHESSDDESDNDDRTYSRHKVSSRSQSKEVDRLTDQPRNFLRRPRKIKKRGIVLLANNLRRNLSRSWSYLQNFAT